MLLGMTSSNETAESWFRASLVFPLELDLQPAREDSTITVSRGRDSQSVETSAASLDESLTALVTWTRPEPEMQGQGTLSVSWSPRTREDVIHLSQETLSQMSRRGIDLALDSYGDESVVEDGDRVSTCLLDGVELVRMSTPQLLVDNMEHLATVPDDGSFRTARLSLGLAAEGQNPIYVTSALIAYLSRSTDGLMIDGAVMLWAPSRAGASGVVRGPVRMGASCCEEVAQ